MGIGNRIKDLLSENKISGRELAENIGVSQGTISKVINGKSTSFENIGKIATGLNTTTDFLIFGHENFKDIIEIQLLEKFKDLNYDNKILVTKYVTEIWMEQNRPNKEKS